MKQPQPQLWPRVALLPKQPRSEQMPAPLAATTSSPRPRTATTTTSRCRDRTPGLALCVIRTNCLRAALFHANFHIPIDGHDSAHPGTGFWRACAAVRCVARCWPARGRAMNQQPQGAPQSNGQCRHGPGPTRGRLGAKKTQSRRQPVAIPRTQ